MKLQQHFPYQGEIELTEHRGITVAQLRRVLHFVAEHCASWVDTAPAQYSATSGQPISLEWANLYHINTWLIRPATQKDLCAFVELLAKRGQVAKWFISHWWGEPIWEFFACVAKHAVLHGLDDVTAYWVCAYANRQHCLGAELSIDPKDSSFYKAMQLAHGILLVLDSRKEASGPATPFSRIWCDFEESLAVNGVLDVATFSFDGASHAQKDLLAVARCRTKGCPYLENPHRGDHYCCGACRGGKGHDSSDCPKEICTVLDDQPKFESPGCLFVQHPFQGHCHCCWHCKKEPGSHGPACMRHNSQSWADEVGHEAVSALASKGRPEILTHGCLRVDGWTWPLLRKAQRECTFPIDIIEAGLSVEIQNGKATVAQDRVHILNSIAGQALDAEPLESHNSYDVVNGKLRAKFALAALQRVAIGGTVEALDKLLMKVAEDVWSTELQLDLYSCRFLEDTLSICKAILHRRQCTRLVVNLGRCLKLECIRGLGEGISSLFSLQNLRIVLSDCDGLADITSLGDSLACLAHLRDFVLEAPHCNRLALAGLSTGLAGKKSLEFLKLRFGHCSRLASMGNLGQAWASCTNLRVLFLVLCACDALTGIEEDIEVGLTGHPALQCFWLNMKRTTKILDIEPIGRGCLGAPQLKLVNMDFENCPRLKGLAGFTSCVRKLPIFPSSTRIIGFGWANVATQSMCQKALQSLRSLPEQADA